MRRIFGAVALLVVGWAGGPDARAQEVGGIPGGASYTVTDFGVMPRPAYIEVLLRHLAVREELGLAEGQVERATALAERHAERLEETRGAIADEDKFEAARAALFRETTEGLAKILGPAQLRRLDQIQLQARGSLAFEPERLPLMDLGGADLKARLKLGDEQARRLGSIADRGRRTIRGAATVFVVFPPGMPRNAQAIDAFVISPEFRTAKANVRKAAQVAWAGVIREIEAALTESQRQAYRAMLGAPFDLSSLHYLLGEATRDAEQVAEALEQPQFAPDPFMQVPVAFGLNLAQGEVAVMIERVEPPGAVEVQRADPEFDLAVARPGYPGGGPRVVIDEAHANFHTSEGRYRPFAQLIGNDGYAVSPGTEKFSAASLAKGEVLVVANATIDGAEGTRITEEEADAVLDWVRGGGALLLVTDRPPFGVGSKPLADRFGVNMSLAQTNDPANSQDHPANLSFSVANGLLGDHPILKGRGESERVARVLTFAGQSLRGPADARILLEMGEGAVDLAAGKAPSPAKGRAQGLAFRAGKGRVVVLGEAAVLSAQTIRGEPLGMNVPGSHDRQFALNLMHWLSGLLEPEAKAP